MATAMRPLALVALLVLVPTALATTYDDGGDDAGAVCSERAARLASVGAAREAGALVLEYTPVSVDLDFRCVGLAVPIVGARSSVYRDVLASTPDHRVEFQAWDRILEGVRSGVCVGVSVFDGTTFDAWSTCAAGPEDLPTLQASLPLAGTRPGQFGPVTWDVTGETLAVQAFARADTAVGEETDEAGPFTV